LTGERSDGRPVADLVNDLSGGHLALLLGKYPCLRHGSRSNLYLGDIPYSKHTGKASLHGVLVDCYLSPIIIVYLTRFLDDLWHHLRGNADQHILVCLAAILKSELVVGH